VKISPNVDLMKMNTEEEGKKGLLNGSRASFWRFALVMTCIFAAVLCLGSGNNVLHWIAAKAEIKRQAAQKELYLKEIEDMDKSINMMRSDADTLEKVARENLHMCAPDEDVYVID